MTKGLGNMIRDFGGEDQREWGPLVGKKIVSIEASHEALEGGLVEKTEKINVPQNLYFIAGVHTNPIRAFLDPCRSKI